MAATKTYQLHVRLPNQAGQLEQVLSLISHAGVDILGYVGWSQGEDGHLLLVTVDNARTETLLAEAGHDVSRQDAVVVRGANVVGQGARLAAKLTQAHVNLRLALATATGSEYLTILQADDNDKLLAALK